MRQIGDHSKPQKLPKIIILTILLAFGTFAALKFFNLEKVAFRAPKTIVQLITDSGLKSDRGRTNVLLLGIGGDGHDGPDLTDTIILASIDKKDGDVIIVSIPRDLWVPDGKYKIN